MVVKNWVLSSEINVEGEFGRLSVVVKTLNWPFNCGEFVGIDEKLLGGVVQISEPSAVEGVVVGLDYFLSALGGLCATEGLAFAFYHAVNSRPHD